MPGKSLFPLLISCITAFALTACNNGRVKPYAHCVSSHEAVVPISIRTGKMLNLYLDSLMVLGISTPIDYHDKEQVLYVFDSYNKRLLEYPLMAAGDTVQPRKVLPVHVKDKISYFKYISADSLVLYAYGGAKLLYYSVSRGVVDKEYAFMKHKTAGMHAAPPYANAATPILFSGQTVTGFGFLLGEQEGEPFAARTVCATIELKTGNTSYRIAYPEVYREHNWGGSHLRTPYAAYNEQRRLLLLSFPADHHIRLVDSSWQHKDVYAGSREQICITSMALPKSSEQVLDVDYALQYYTGTPSYRNIICDPYHNRYYRILELPPAQPELANGKPAGKRASLIAFDSDLQYLGEAALPDGLALDNFFVTAEGLYFLNVRNKDQNMAQYALCTIAIEK
ncbi:DUF4221 family protein [uncultured Chitinophaga sp.]|jgi:hypothetical protein|uniref:DUF4221 family protein n=1 Tax=uncultured Chitinophaga sp. TaxID=339340 RepID=UPI00260E0D4A|nr:DUF4221 family protein [uncultured Chitinophaga sp.]